MTFLTFYSSFVAIKQPCFRYYQSQTIIHNIDGQQSKRKNTLLLCNVGILLACCRESWYSEIITKFLWLINFFLRVVFSRMTHPHVNMLWHFQSPNWTQLKPHERFWTISTLHYDQNISWWSMPPIHFSDACRIGALKQSWQLVVTQLTSIGLDHDTYCILIHGSTVIFYIWLPNK